MLIKRAITNVEDAIAFSSRFGFPIKVSPWFSLGGAGQTVAKDTGELKKGVEEGLKLSPLSQVELEKVPE